MFNNTNFADDNPAPNRYDVKHSSLSSIKRPPSCKLGKRLVSSTADHTSGPGPAAYNTRHGPDKQGGIITPRRQAYKGLFKTDTVIEWHSLL